MNTLRSWLKEVDAVNVENTVREKTGDPQRTDYNGIPIPKELLITPN